jgi:hypothetical protein
MAKEAIIKPKTIATNCWICDFFIGQFYGLEMKVIWGNI